MIIRFSQYLRQGRAAGGKGDESHMPTHMIKGHFTVYMCVRVSVMSPNFIYVQCNEVQGVQNICH